MTFSWASPAIKGLWLWLATRLKKSRASAVWEFTSWPVEIPGTPNPADQMNREKTKILRFPK
jgi:hypothetical protein